MKKHIIIGVLIFFIALVAYQPIKADAAWKKVDGVKYYYNEKGKLLKNRWIGNYYADANGAMAKNTWVGQYFVGNDGKWIPNFNGGWYKIRGKWYYYKKSGKLCKGWITVKNKQYYLDKKTGAMLTKWQDIDGSRYYFHKKDGHMLTGWQTIGKYTYYLKKGGKLAKGLKTISGNLYYFGSKKGRLRTGFQKVNGNVYYFNPKSGKNNGKALKGWQTINGKKYYFKKSTYVMYTGLHSIGGYTYYFNSSGVMQKNKAVTVNGYVYNIDSTGKCTLKVTIDISGLTDKMVFFARFESGTAGYNQTGGDNGAACGYYQFDYRYSLLPLVKYCYSADPILFAEFKTYASYSSGTKLKSNKKFYKAWNTIYNRSPEGFASYQDAYAKQQYYDVTVRCLANMGISLSGRSDVVKGAVFSYSIQHGAETAAYAVKYSKVYNMTDKNFITGLYNYRISMYPSYKSRYTQEKALALSLL